MWRSRHGSICCSARDRMHIALVIPHLGSGGAERVASLLCNCWAQFGHRVTALTFDAPGVDPFFRLDEAVQQRPLDTLNKKTNLISRVATNVRRLWRLRSNLTEMRPEIVIAFMTEASVVTVCATLGLGLPVIVTERNQPDRPGLGWFRRSARRLTYPWASAMVVQTEDIAGWAKARFSLPVHVLPNPVMTPGLGGIAPANEGRLIVSAGRLVYQKGFDLLIDGFARVAELHPDWRLVIYGEGPERANLQTQIERHSLRHRISLPGLFTDSNAALGQADLFVLASRFEGCSNVLLEALSLGRPVIATNCPGATAAILDGGHYGLLIPPTDIDALTGALDDMMSNATLRSHYAGRAPLAVAHLEPAKVAHRWLELFSSLNTVAG